ncbi:hypothetical protein FHP05_08765 [Cerasibacillus terrae]|uniref:Uncharacterized protein n=1 Tax=Cerasibacillus terrae TaxID=2498845 RepID=A0A5C8NTP2_9BACI|nr:hypothetical protein [Cerasibacillus terrae]TXL64407.1 hypothetical protein FHP05_08765 [Cerasibacillus terrae]
MQRNKRRTSFWVRMGAILAGATFGSVIVYLFKGEMNWGVPLGFLIGIAIISGFKVMKDNR